MLKETDIELKAQQYLQLFQLNHQQNIKLIKQLQTKLNLSAKTIQNKWRHYIQKRKFHMAIKIQSAWKKYYKYKQQRSTKIQKFKQTFYKGKIAHFIFKKLFSQRKQFQRQQNINQLLKNPIKAFYLPKKQKPNHTSINNKIAKYFPSYITLSQTYKAEQKYIQKLRVYEKQRFSQTWQRYQQSLKAQLLKQASKKWVKKNKQIWINQQSKQINLQEYIQRHVEKIFKREYQKYKQADIKLEKTSILLGQNIQRFKRQYYAKILPLKI